MSRIAFVSTFAPEPIRSGFSMRIHGILANAPAEAEVLRVYPSDRPERFPPHVAFTPKRVSRFRELSSLIPQIVLPYRNSPDRCEVLRKIRDFRPSLVIVSGLHVFPMAPSGFPILYDSHNVEWHLSQGLMRYSHDSIVHRSHRMLTTWKLRRWENRKARECEHLIACSDTNAEYFSELRNEPVPVVYNGTDTDHWRMDRSPERGLILFPGDMSYYPNIDAAEFLALDVLPRLRERGWSGKLVLAGRSPDSRVQSLVRPDVEVTGTVEDIREYYRRAQVLLAPLRIGSGTPLKVITGLAAGVPVITMPRVARSLGLDDSDPVLLAETADQTAQRVLELENDSALAARMSESGVALAEERYSWRVTGSRFWSEVLGFMERMSRE